MRTYVFGLSEEAGVSVENPHKHRENMQNQNVSADHWIWTQDFLAPR